MKNINLNFLKSKIINSFYKTIRFKNKVFEIIFLIPFLEKPYPNNPFGKKPKTDKNNYLRLFRKANQFKNKFVDEFENELGFRINEKWFNQVCLITQTCIKNSDLNYNHGRILYSLLSNYISKKHEKGLKNLTILETGTARGFSALCMSKAINDLNANGKVITIDCIPHNKKIFWNCITDFEGKKTRKELLSSWPFELGNIIFIQGWTINTLEKIETDRINFAFLDAQHTKKSVLEEFFYINARQKKGDIIFFDDVTPGLFDGVCEAVNEIEHTYNYQIHRLNFDKNRGYAIAKKT